MAAVMTDAPAPLDGTSFDPYGQLLKMLLPRANSIVIYDRLGVSLWASENDDAELQGLMQQANVAELAERGAVGHGFAEPLPGEQIAYCLHLARQRRQRCWAASAWSAASRTASRARSRWCRGWCGRPSQCLERELAAQSSIGDLQRSLSCATATWSCCSASRRKKPMARTPPTTSRRWCRAASTTSAAPSARC